jgi:hypothetical protein
MGYGKNNQTPVSSGFTKYIVVESFEACPCHSAVTVYIQKELNLESYSYLFVRNLSDINFGDILLLDVDSGEWYLSRGPNLQYHLHLDEFPDGLAEKLIADRVTDNPPHQPRFKF